MEVWGGISDILTEIVGVGCALERLLLSRSLGRLRWVDVSGKAVLRVGVMGSLILLDLLGKMLEMLCLLLLLLEMWGLMMLLRLCLGLLVGIIIGKRLLLLRSSLLLLGILL